MTGLSYKTTGSRIKSLRKNYKPGKLSQEDFADLLDCDKSTVVAWEHGTLPSTEYLLKLSEFFHVSVDYLLCKIDETDHDLNFIHEKTGLSEAAIKKLIDSKNVLMFHDEEDRQEEFSTVVSSIIEHERFRVFVFRLLQSKALRTTITKHHGYSKEEIEKAHDKLTGAGYVVLSPGINNAISIYDAKQEISEIIDDLFRNKETGYIELRR